jgi:predicted phosphodiesterase
MRIAVLSDIHGNLWALEAALADAKQQDVDVIVNAGDILSGPLEPAGTADLLMSLGLPTIAGNHERQLLACAGRPGGASDQHAFERTTAAQRDWLRGLPSTLELGSDVFVCHGTPASDCTYFLEETDVAAPAGIRAATQETVERHAAGLAHSLIVCGHSHMPRVRAISAGRLVVNPGSVGLQAYDDDQPHHHAVSLGSPHARYAVCEQTAHGWNVGLRQVAYDHATAAATALRHGRPEWARWLATGQA